MRLAFLGSGAFGLPTLAHLATRHHIACVVTQPDRPAGRGMELTAPPIAAWARTNLPAVPLLQPPDINQPDACAAVRNLADPGQADAWVIIAFGQKLSPALLAGVRAINLHASLLPRWRGAAPIHAAILAGDAETGNSVITIADRMDAGLVLGQSARPLDPHLTTGELHDLLAADGPALVEHVLLTDPPGHAQDESLATRARKLRKTDAWIDLHDTADAARRRVHGLNPWPGVAITLDAKPLKLLRVAVGPPHAASPGLLLDPARGVISCGGGTTLALLDVQPPGGRAMPWAAFASGRRPAAGASVTSRPEAAA